MTNTNIVPVSEVDYLEEDAQIRGQEYVCLSFLSPDKVLDNKDVFMFTKFTENFCKDVNELFENLKIKYPDEDDTFKSIADRYRFLFNKAHMQEEYKYFMDEKAEELDNEFSETVDFQTNVRGIKVRGSYNTMKEAQIRSEVLKRKDKNHNIYIAQVGCWCPWDPNPNDIQDQHYAEDKLNTLMKKYRENQQYKDEVFDDRKNDMLDAQKERHARIEEQNKAENVDNSDNVGDSENVVLNEDSTSGNLVEDVVKTAEDVVKTAEDVAKTVKDVKSGNVIAAVTDVVKDVEDIKEVVNDVENVVNDLTNKVENTVISDTGLDTNNTITENYNEQGASSEKVFEGSDPWLNRKENPDVNNDIEEVN